MFQRMMSIGTSQITSSLVRKLMLTRPPGKSVASFFFVVYENDYLLCRLDDIYESQEKVPVESEDVSANASDSILSDEAFRRSIFSTALVLGRPRSRQDSRTES